MSAIRQADFVSELCLALAHRWEPDRNFVIITAYFDESGTHGGSPISLMAGFVGDARQWREFNSRATKLFRAYKVDIFHAIDLKRSDNDFSGWSVDTKINFIDEFHHLVNQTLEVGFASRLRLEDYEYYTNLPWPKRVRKDSQYALLFRASLSAVLSFPKFVNRWSGRDSPINIVLESGHRNAADALRVYNAFIGSPKELSGLTFASKVKCLPLAAADLFAYSVFSEETGAKKLGKAKISLNSESSYNGNTYSVTINREIIDKLFRQQIIRRALR